ncbi:MAG: chorismate mutase [Parashewanella sp.]
MSANSIKVASILLLLFSALIAQSSAQATTNDIFSIVNQRLSICTQVAQIKQIKGLAVTNEKQERVVLQKAQATAHQFGLDPTSVIKFTQALIISCKQIQTDYLNANHSLRKAPSLIELRAQLADINQQLFKKLSDLLAKNHLAMDSYHLFEKQVADLNLTTTNLKQLFNALIEISKINK